MNQELQEAINTMYTNASIYLSKMRGAPNPVGPVGPKPSNFPQGIVGQVELLFCSQLEAEWLSGPQSSPSSSPGVLHKVVSSFNSGSGCVGLCHRMIFWKKPETELTVGVLKKHSEICWQNAFLKRIHNSLHSFGLVVTFFKQQIRKQTVLLVTFQWTNMMKFCKH